MSAWVTLKSGIVVEYNNCKWVDLEGDCFVLAEKASGSDLIAKIPKENVERFEFERPCKIYRQRRKDKLPII
jgi:hypothetical protein